jgi:uncharacterized protein YqfB (UPF0267 family)
VGEEQSPPILQPSGVHDMDPLSTHVESFLQHIRIERNYYYCVIKTMHIETVHMSDSRKDHAREYALAGYKE